MFLTRVGFGSTAVITGDVTQIDLPSNKPSGLRHVLEVLKEVEGISFYFFWGTRCHQTSIGTTYCFCV